MIQKKYNCISCGSNLSEDIVIIGEQYPSAIYISENDSFINGLKPTSLNIVRCTNEKCGLVQLSNSYDLQYVFDHYPYESGTTSTMKNILEDVVLDAEKMVKINDSDVVLDIGGNDGTLLGFIKKTIKARINIDAAKGVKQICNGSNYKHIHARFTKEVYSSLCLPNPKLIFSIAMFYHLTNPLQFCRDIYDIMGEESVWILQMTYLGTMLEDNILDNIVHEHNAYYSLQSLETLLAQVGLKVIDAKIVKSYGGSIRAFIVKDNSKAYECKCKTEDYYKVKEFEQEHKTNTYESLYAFNSRVQLLKSSIGSIVEYLVSKHGSIHGFGASTKGNMLLQWLGIKSDKMPYILDNNIKKIGTKTIGSDITIVSEEKFLKQLPDYLFILPYYYTNSFVKTIQKNLKLGQEVTLLIPLPYPYFITINNHEGVLNEK